MTSGWSGVGGSVAVTGGDGGCTGGCAGGCADALLEAFPVG